MKLAHATFITRRRYAEQSVATRGEPVIEDGTKFSERPNAHKGSEPLPTRQHADYFDPREVAFVPMSVRRTHVHLLGHLFTRMRRSAFENLGLIVIQPFKPLVAIAGLNVFARPAA